jgi:hypothetical protein
MNMDKYVFPFVKSGETIITQLQSKAVGTRSDIIKNLTSIFFTINTVDWKIWIASGLTSIFYGMTIIILHYYLNKIDYVQEYNIINSIYKINNKNDKKEELEKENIDLLHQKPKKELKEEDELKEKERIQFENEKIQLKAKHLKNVTIVNFLSSMVLFISYSFGFVYGLINLIYTVYFDIFYDNPTFLNNQDDLDKIILMFIVQGFIWDIVAGMDFYPNLMKSRLLKNIGYTIATIYGFSKNNIKFISIAYLSEFPEIIIYANIMCGIHIKNKFEKMFFSFYYVFFKIIVPIFSLFYININKLNLEIELQVVMALKIWFEICLFTIFIVDKFILKTSDIKKEKIEVGKNE